MADIQPELPQKMPINSGKLIIKSLEITDLTKYLAQYTPAELKKITLIDCSSNKFANLNIKNLPKLKEFCCCYSGIKSANIDAPNLHILDLSNNKIEDIKLETPLLEKIIISSNELSEFKLNLPNLKYMDCINNKITSFRDFIAPTLHELYAQYNSISSVGDLNSPVNISYLDKNCLRSLESISANQILKTNLRKLSCCGGDIDSDMFKVPFSSSLFCLNHRDNISAKLNEINFDAPNLTELNLRYNEIMSAEDMDCPNLISFDISANKMITADMDTPNLVTLNISINELTTFSGMINPKLEELNCNINQLTDIAVKCPNIKKITASENQITNFSYMDTPNLEELIISKNNIDCFYSTDMNGYAARPLFLPKLKKLNIDDNKLQSLCGLFAQSLEELNCQMNNLTDLEFERGNNNFAKLAKLVCFNVGVQNIDVLLELPNLNNLIVKEAFCIFDGRQQRTQMTDKYLKNFRTQYNKSHHKRLSMYKV